MAKKTSQLMDKEYIRHIGVMATEAAKNHEEVNAHIEFAYENYEAFIKFCQDRIKGKKLSWEVA